MHDGETIAAISTPLGEGGIGIVRISGNDAIKLLKKVAKPYRKKNWEECRSHSLHNAYIVDKDNEVVDEVLISIMRAPKSFTGEDVVEINCHGGIVAVSKTLEVVIAAGARLAEAGEFTKRAFLNGRIDLAQAESVIDVIRAKTNTGLKVALKQLEGHLSQKIKVLKEKLLEILIQMEAGIDFPEDEVPYLSPDEAKRKLKEIAVSLKELIDDAGRGRIIREGIKAVIIGKPNVGKSSLLNALLNENRALVTEIPGTTRDVIEEVINIKGIPLRIIDTAGIRKTENLVEELGVEKTRSSIEEAAIILFMLDATTDWTEQDEIIARELIDKEVLVLVNKIDVQNSQEISNGKQYFKESEFIYISAKEGMGIKDLENAIIKRIMGGKVVSPENLIITKARHLKIIKDAYNHVNEAISALQKGFTDDLVCIDVKAAWLLLGKITGETVEEDMIDRIFEEFCIGK